MEVFDILTAVAEVSIALAGFGGIAAGLGYRAGGSWHGDDLFRLLIMVIVCLLIVFTCFIPSTLQSLELNLPWRTASAFILTFSIGLLAVQLRRFRAGLPPGYNLPVTLALFGSNIMVLGISTILALGIPEVSQRPGVYLASVLSFLVIPSILFVRLIITAFSPVQNIDDV